MNSITSLLVGITYIIPTVYLFAGHRWFLAILVLNSAVPIGLGLIVAQSAAGVSNPTEVALNVIYGCALAIWLSMVAAAVWRKFVV